MYRIFVGRHVTIPKKYKENFDVSSEGPLFRVLNEDERPSLKTLKFSYSYPYNLVKILLKKKEKKFKKRKKKKKKGSCIPTNESLFKLLALLTLAQIAVQDYV